MPPDGGGVAIASGMPRWAIQVERMERRCSAGGDLSPRWSSFFQRFGGVRRWLEAPYRKMGVPWAVGVVGFG